MSIPESELAKIQAWVAARNDELPVDVADQVRYELDVDARSATIFECRPPWREDFGPDWTRMSIARLRYTQTRREWTLYWSNQHGQFRLYDTLSPAPGVEPLLAEIDRDPTCIFWG